MKYQKEVEMFTNAWGQESQERMAIEEMSELIKELCKHIRLTKDDFLEADSEKLKINIQHVKEEIADVCNMMEQLKFMYGEEEIEKIQDEKIKRTLKLLNK